MRYFYECSICEALHPSQSNNDCRDDGNRYFADELDRHFGAENWTAVPMSEADEWPICFVVDARILRAELPT